MCAVSSEVCLDLGLRGGKDVHMEWRVWKHCQTHRLENVVLMV